MDRVIAIRERLQTALSPIQLEITDDSEQHQGHLGAAAGGGHFSVRIVSKTFEGLPLLQRHQEVYAALAELMKSEIHALSIETLSPNEM